MKTSSITVPRMFVLLLCVLLATSPAQAETTNCTAITTLPFIINAQGVYCFTSKLSTNITSGSAIIINTNNVTIDLNGFKLGGLAAGDGTEATGIYAFQRKNITIRNGIVRGFDSGIWLGDASPYTTSQGHLIEDILADQNTLTGITVRGRGNTIRRNQVVDTGGSTIFNFINGIEIFGPGNDVLNNRIATTTASSTGEASGIFLADADGSVVQDNRVGETMDAGEGSYGILIRSSDFVTARNNTITTADFGLFYDGDSTGKYMGNLTDDIATTAFTGGTAVGTNN